MNTLDLDFVRSQFPAFDEPSLQGQAFFENAGGTYACRDVAMRLNRFYRDRKVQPYAPFAASQRGGDEMDEARTRLSQVLGVAENELSFGPSTSANSYIMANAFRDFLEPGDAIVVTNQDHEANTGAWRRLAQSGVDVREWQIDPETGHLSVDSLLALLDDGKVRLVCYPHCSNVVGEINDVATINFHIHAAGAVACVDGVSYAPHGLPDVGALDADIYFLSAYKTYGPHQGLMVVRQSLAEQLPNQGHYFNADTLYKRFTPAGPDHAQVAACAGIADYIDGIYAHHDSTDRDATDRARVVHDLMRAHETRLLGPLLAYLGDNSKVRVLGPQGAQSRAPTVALVHDRPGMALAAELAALNVMAGGGDFYANRALQAMGVDPDHGVLRLSFVHYTSPAEIDQLIGALDQVL